MHGRVLWIVLAAVPIFSAIPWTAADEKATSKGAEQKRSLSPEEEKDALRRYQHVPKTASELLAAMQKLEAKVDAGINYDDYDRAVQDLHADAMVFARSDEAKPVHELSFTLVNASVSYTVVRREWNTSLFGKTDVERSAAKLVLASVRDRLWKLASTNLDCARDMAGSAPEKVVGTINRLRLNPELFRPEKVFDEIEAAEKRREEERIRREREAAKASDEATAKRWAEAKAEEESHWRNWSKADGTALGRARFMGLSGGKVKLKKEDRTVLTVPLEELGGDEQKWIKGRAKHHK